MMRCVVLVALLTGCAAAPQRVDAPMLRPIPIYAQRHCELICGIISAGCNSVFSRAKGVYVGQCANGEKFTIRGRWL